MILSRIRANKFLGSIFLLAGGSAIAQGITVGVTPILTRLFSPEEFGTFAAFVSVLSIVLVMASMRFEFAIPQIQNRKTAQGLVCLCSILVLVMSLLVLCFLTFTTLINATVGSGWGVFWLLPLGLLFAGAFQVANYWIIREKAFKALAVSGIKRSLMQSVAQVSLGFTGMGVLALVIGYVAGQAIGSKLLTQGMPAKKFLSGWRSRVIAYRYRRFPIFSVPAGLLNVSAVHITPLLLIYMYGAVTAGFFSLAQRAMGAPMAFLGMAIANVFLSELPRIRRDKPEQLMGFYLRACRNLAMIGLPIVAGATAVLWFGVELIFGEEWSDTALFALCLAPLFLGQFVVAPLSQTLTVLERQDVQLFWDLLRLVIPNLVVVAAYYSSDAVVDAVLGYGLSMFFIYIINIVVTLFVMRRVRW